MEEIYSGLSLYIRTVEPHVSGFTLFLKGDPVPTGDLDLFLKGENNSNTWSNILDRWGDLEIAWDNMSLFSTGIITSSLSLYISGGTTIDYSGNIPLYINATGTDDRNNNLPLYIQAPESNTSYITLYLKTDDVPENNLPLYVHGQTGLAPDGVSFNNLPLYISGAIYNENNSGTIPLYLKVVSTGDLNDYRTLYVSGTNVETLTLPLYLHNQESTGNIPLYIQGYWTSKTMGSSSSAGQANRGGGWNIGSSYYSSSYYRNTYNALGVTSPNKTIMNSQVFNPSRNLIFGVDSMDGAKPVTGTITLFISNTGVGTGLPLYVHNVLSSGYLDLYVEGSYPQVTGTLPLYTICGTGDTDGNLPLFIKGY